MIKIVVISSAPALRLGLCSALTAGAGAEIVAQAAVPADLDGLVEGADVLVFAPGNSFAWSLRDLNLDLPLLLLVENPISPDLLLEISDFPAWGILSLEASPAELQAAAQALAQGLCVAPPEYFSAFLDRDIPLPQELDEIPEPLTERETEVLQLIGQGLTNKQIASRLFISEHTVKFHTSAIFSKMGVSNRTEAVRLGARSGLISF